MTNKGFALARAGLIEVLTAYSGIATADGADDGTTLIDSNLIGKDSQKIVADWEDKGATAFNTVTGQITLQGTGFSAQIKAGTIYKILNISSIEIDVANIETKVDAISVILGAGKMLFSMDFWSDLVEEIQLDGDVAATLALGTVNIADLPSGATIVRAIAMFKFRMIENTNAAANKLDGATVANTSQVIQVADDTPGTYYDAINFVDDQFGLAAETREGGDVIIGSIDWRVICPVTVLNAVAGYLFRWLLALADEDYLNFNDVQVGLRIWYSL